MTKVRLDLKTVNLADLAKTKETIEDVRRNLESAEAAVEMYEGFVTLPDNGRNKSYHQEIERARKDVKREKAKLAKLEAQEAKTKKIEFTEVSLDHLAGAWGMLTGVDREMVRMDKYQDAEQFSFVFDGQTYTAIQDPNDGYRSSMEKLVASNKQLSNTFKPVYCMVMITKNDEAHWLELIDKVTGKVILRTGTRSLDDYYPSFVAEFFPEDMCENALPQNRAPKPIKKDEPKVIWYGDW